MLNTPPSWRPSFATARTELLICTVNYAEALVRPAGRESGLRAAVSAIASLGIHTPAPDAARHRGLGMSLADGFALAMAARSGAELATFDRRVRRALAGTGLRFSPALEDRGGAFRRLDIGGT